jgi:hypothetical protein
MLTWCIVPPVDRTLFGIAPLSFEKEFEILPPT